MESFRRQVSSAMVLDPVIINVHSGHDAWDVDTAVGYFTQVLAIEKELTATSSTTIVHETHRQRQLHSPFQAAALFSRPEMQNLKINADLSHWVCLCERVFQLDGARDPWWPILLSKLAERCRFIHARIGHAEGPQVFDPRREDLFKPEVDSHLTWWETIWNEQRSRGSVAIYVEPEHGPEPYQVYYAVPGKATASDDLKLDEEAKSAILWEINRYVGERVKTKYEE